MTKCFSAAVSLRERSWCLSSLRICSRISSRLGRSGASWGGFEEAQGEKVDEPIMDRNVRAAWMWIGQFPPRVRNTFTRPVSASRCQNLALRLLNIPLS